MLQPRGTEYSAMECSARSGRDTVVLCLRVENSWRQMPQMGITQHSKHDRYARGMWIIVKNCFFYSRIQIAAESF